MLKIALIVNLEDSLEQCLNYFKENQNKIEKLTAKKIEITYILNDFNEKELNFSVKKEYKKAEITDDYNKILSDSDIDIIIDLSRHSRSFEYLQRALKRKKTIITSNSKVIAENYLEIKKLENKFESRVFFSAAFSPLPLKTLTDNFYILDELNEINAVLNITTNYILSEMEKNTISMKETIEQAEELSYTEQDSDLDLNGDDSLNKLIMLADLFYNTAVDPEMIRAKGIKGITSYDLIYAAELGYKIKLVCTIKKEGENLYLGVSPNLVPRNSFLASINENSNGIELYTNNNSKTIFKTENSNSASVNLLTLDLINAVKSMNRKTEKNYNFELNNLKHADLYQSKQSSFYVRLQLEKDEENIREIKKIFSEKNLADLILHDNLTETPLLPVIIMTKEIKEADLEKLLKEVEELEGVLTVNNIIAVKAD